MPQTTGFTTGATTGTFGPTVAITAIEFVTTPSLTDVVENNTWFTNENMLMFKVTYSVTGGKLDAKNSTQIVPAIIVYEDGVVVNSTG